MSRKTFLKWIFSWMAQMKIDFRKEIDPWCKYDPEILACDGTHIGLSLRHLNLQNPITKTDCKEEITPHHKR